MAKKKIARKSNTTLNIFDNGGTMTQKSKDAFGEAFSSKNIGGSIASIAGSVSTIANAGFDNAQIADTSNIQNSIKQAQSHIVGASNNDELMNEWGSYSPIENISWKSIRGGSSLNRAANTVNAVGSGVATGAQIGGPIGGIIGGVIGLGSSIGGWLGGNRKAKRKARNFNKQINNANTKNLIALEDRADSLDTQNDLNIMANYAAYGGLFDTPSFGGAIDYELAKEDLNIKNINALSKDKITSLPNSFNAINTFADGGSINIKPSKKGTFTEAAKKHNKGVQEFATQVLANKDNYSPEMIKKANFAKNAAGWKHAEGGTLITDGAEWDTGVNIIGNGGTHEENPMEGVPVSVDSEGNPNLVEQGEVIFNNYVFSNRLGPTKSILDIVNLPNKYNDKTFAYIAEKLSKESSERPNDPISKRGLTDSMIKLQIAQEFMKQSDNKSSNNQKKNKYSEGGLSYPYNPNRDFSVFSGFYDTPSQDWGQVSSQNVENIINNLDTNYSDNVSTTTDISKPNGSKATWLRYAPVLGAAIGVAQNTFSKPDYSSANALLEAANNIGRFTPVGYNPIGNYLQYKPLDRNYYTNKLNAQAGATRRAIMNSSNPSRNAALLAADYNTQTQLGALARQAEEYNLAQRQAVESFNRDTNKTNSDMALRTALANQSAMMQSRSSKLSGIAQAMNIKDNINARKSQSMSANLTNLFNSLGDIGREAYSRNMILSNPALYYSIDSKGNITYKNGYENLSEAEKKEVRDAANKNKSKKGKE